MTDRHGMEPLAGAVFTPAYTAITRWLLLAAARWCR
jgi:hypothetical protein